MGKVRQMSQLVRQGASIVFQHVGEQYRVTQTVMHAERLDGFVGLAGCDKSIPAMSVAMLLGGLNVAIALMRPGSSRLGESEALLTLGFDLFQREEFVAAGKAVHFGDQLWQRVGHHEVFAVLFEGLNRWGGLFVEDALFEDLFP